MEQELKCVGSADCCLVFVVHLNIQPQMKFFYSVISPSCPAVHWWCTILSSPRLYSVQSAGCNNVCLFYGHFPTEEPTCVHFPYSLRSFRANKVCLSERVNKRVIVNWRKVGLLHIETGVCAGSSVMIGHYLHKAGSHFPAHSPGRRIHFFV